MNFNKPMFALHPEMKDEFCNGTCISCKGKVDKSVMSDIELRELDVSGYCADCQREIFEVVA